MVRVLKVGKVKKDIHMVLADHVIYFGGFCTPRKHLSSKNSSDVSHLASVVCRLRTTNKYLSVVELLLSRYSQDVRTKEIRCTYIQTEQQPHR